jgi:predicted cupin superfamily sugar epimerase
MLTPHHARMTTEESAEQIIRRLGLVPHPEGGFYTETFRSKEMVTLADGRLRAAGTAIYFLLPEGTFSALHRVAADEAWHHYTGAPLELITISPEGVTHRILLGSDLAAGQRPQHMVPAGHWQGARPLPAGNVNSNFTLVGCTVAPGFDFADFEMPGRPELLSLFPEHRELILEFT